MGDGIQHAAHGQLNLDAYQVDGYAISPYKVFSRHGYGVAWISGRMTALPHETLIGGPFYNWELPDCIRLSTCHYNTRQEVAHALRVLNRAFK